MIPFATPMPSAAAARFARERALAQPSVSTKPRTVTETGVLMAVVATAHVVEIVSPHLPLHPLHPQLAHHSVKMAVAHHLPVMPTVTIGTI